MTSERAPTEHTRPASQSTPRPTPRTPPSPRLVLVCGLPGAGKTTVAGTVVDELDAVRIRTDVVRKDLFDDPTYSDAETEAVYNTVCERAATHLANGDRVVLDGTFRERSLREPALDLARDHGVDRMVLKVEADDDVVKRRIRQREDDASDADVSVYEHYRDRFDPIQVDHAVVDNSGSLDDTRAQLTSLI